MRTSHGRSSQHYPVSHAVIGVIALVLLLIAVLGLLWAILPLPSLAGLHPTLSFIEDLVPDLFFLYLGYFVFRRSRGWYSTSGMALLVLGVISVVSDVVNWRVFDMTLAAQPVLGTLSYVLSALLIVCAVPTTHYLLTHASWPKLHGPLKWGTYTFGGSIACLFLIIITSIVGVLYYGPKAIDPMTLQGTVLFQVGAILTLLWVVLLVASIVLTIIAGVKWVITRSSKPAFSR